MEELKLIIQDLKKIIQEEHLDISSNTIFENAVKIFISDRINKSIKKTNEQPYIHNYNEEKKEYKTPTEKITDKQLNYLKKQGYKNPERLTKIEAKEIIGNYLDNLNKRNI